MGYHFSHSSKVPKTKKEKLRAAKQYFIVTLIGVAATFASIGWVYWQQKATAERARAQAEHAKANEELFRDLARSQGGNSPASSSENQPTPARNSFSINALLPIFLPGILGVISLLMFSMAISSTMAARRMIEPPDS